MVKKIFTLFFIVLAGLVHGQEMTLEELKAKKQALQEKMAPVKAQLDPLTAEMGAIDAAIANLPGWYTGVSGIVGANFIGRNNWFAAGDNKNATSTTLSMSLNSFANLIQKKYFWRNAGSLSLGWQKLKIDDIAPDPDFTPIADVLNLNSLFGYNIAPKLAASALGEYRTSVIENFNNPGYLDIGVGVTYTPLKNMVFVFHPLNYNFIFAENGDQFTPSLGCKVVGDYNTKLTKGINWRSNLSGFFSYKNNDPALHNGTWTNWLSFTLWKGIGVGIEHGLRFSPQEKALLNIDGNFQNYYVVGLTYNI
ncbi:MAG: DUF3078 domain-containing protein [Saprospiraceae bacterium]|nr:DUF3078 domain-containing protein [Saprospiraceae bacterium]